MFQSLIQQLHSHCEGYIDLWELRYATKGTIQHPCVLILQHASNEYTVSPSYEICNKHKLSVIV